MTALREMPSAVRDVFLGTALNQRQFRHDPELRRKRQEGAFHPHMEIASCRRIRRSQRAAALAARRSRRARRRWSSAALDAIRRAHAPKLRVGIEPCVRPVDPPEHLHSQILRRRRVPGQPHHPSVHFAVELTKQLFERLEVPPDEPVQQVHLLVRLTLFGGPAVASHLRCNHRTTRRRKEKYPVLRGGAHGVGFHRGKSADFRRGVHGGMVLGRAAAAAPESRVGCLAAGLARRARSGPGPGRRPGSDDVYRAIRRARPRHAGDL